ncbi:MAG: hypothetical protein HOU81_15460 [Hamadaea sp.]|uniref:hypothetical protein n=1 Tax=Hamadaea sp. TaxID=2024425 RepID=UPI0017F7426A|nr:hypothetical protein [Hamadaea sp.]NUR72210.1 hypothetical protein [Hamadaea sp.]NUT22103.1 hypothetical protein [Hamadaea sp.]
MVITATALPDVRADAPPSPPHRRLPIVDLVAVVLFVAAGIWLTAALWRVPAGATIIANEDDQAFFEWMLAHAAHALTHGESPLFAGEMNTPAGVNLMANTSILGFALPLAPVTLLGGPALTFTLITTLALIGTPLAWYFVLSRHLVRNRWAALAAAAFCGYAPGLAAQAQGHPNLVAQMLVPVIFWCVVRIHHSPVRRGLILGLLVAYQFFINEEVLFLLAQALAIAVLVTLAGTPRRLLRHWRGYLGGLALAGAVAGVLLAYPMYVQFTGPQSYHGVPKIVGSSFGLDVLSYVSFPPTTAFGTNPGAEQLATNPVEANSFFGWPLLVVLALLVLWQVRTLAVRVALAVAAWFTVLSFGAYPEVDGHPLGPAGPWRELIKIPLFDSVVPARMGLAVIPAFGVIIAVSLDRLLSRDRRRWWPVRVAAAAAVLFALVPLAPRPLAVRPKTPMPKFLADGAWRAYVPSGTSLMYADVTSHGDIVAMRWAAASGLDFALARGYFLGPDPRSPERIAMFSTLYTTTSMRMMMAARTGRPSRIHSLDVSGATNDFEYWKVGAIFLPDGTPNAGAIETTVRRLVGRPGVRVDDALVWRIAS